MSFRPTEMSAIVRTDPDRARRELLKILRECGGSASRVAEAYAVTRRTVDRWIVALELQDRAARMRDRAAAVQ